MNMNVYEFELIDQKHINQLFPTFIYLPFIEFF